MSPAATFIRTNRALALGVLLMAGVLAWLAVSRGWLVHHNPLIDSPQLALESLEAKSLYFNGRARPWLLAQRPELLTPEDRDADSERSRAFVQAVQNWKLFRQLDRKYRFDALLLVGDPSEYRPLLDHLVESKDCTLRYVDHTSLIFGREGGRAWELADFAPVRARFAESKPAEQAEVLAETAVKLLAVKRGDAAKTLLDEASRLDSREPHVANGLAVYYLAKGEWREASEQVERALSADRHFLPALATKTQLLYGMKKFNEAYALSSQLMETMPHDPNLLFYHAKIAHEAHAYKTEVATLEELIKQAEAVELPLGGYQLYLGQAFTALGDAQRAVDAFMLALDDPTLPDDQRAFARENIARIKQRTGL